MAAALAVTPSATRCNIRDSLGISGTGFAVTTLCTITISMVESAAEHTWTVTSDGSGNWSFPGSYKPVVPGLYTIVATDGTSTKTATLAVYV